MVGGGNLRHGGLNTSGIGAATTSAAHFVDFWCSIYLYPGDIFFFMPGEIFLFMLHPMMDRALLSCTP
jgi:hypothetical protein